MQINHIQKPKTLPKYRSIHYTTIVACTTPLHNCRRPHILPRHNTTTTIANNNNKKDHHTTFTFTSNNHPQIRICTPPPLCQTLKSQATACTSDIHPLIKIPTPPPPSRTLKSHTWADLPTSTQNHELVLLELGI